MTPVDLKSCLFVCWFYRFLLYFAFVPNQIVWISFFVDLEAVRLMWHTMKQVHHTTINYWINSCIFPTVFLSYLARISNFNVNFFFLLTKQLYYLVFKHFFRPKWAQTNFSKVFCLFFQSDTVSEIGYCLLYLLLLVLSTAHNR